MSDLIRREDLEKQIGIIEVGMKALMGANTAVNTAVLRNIPSVPQENFREWIPCSERTPDTDRYVLCTTENKKGVRTVVRGYYAGDSWAVGMNPNVIAWMEMPEPYQGGQ